MEFTTQGLPLQELASSWNELAGECQFPAAVLDANMVYLAVNKPYARLHDIPPVGFAGKKYWGGARNTHTIQLLLKGAYLGEPFEFPLVRPAEGVGGLQLMNWSLTPLKSPKGLVLGLLIEYLPGAPGTHGRTREE